ncbi:MAG: carbon-nitrogen hydrolase family protein [Casimicrobiaceae bacterium]
MARLLTIAAAQTAGVEQPGSDAIVAAAHAMLDEAGKQRVRLLTFGELFLAPFFANRLEQDFDRYFMRVDDPIIAGLIDKARELRVAMVLPIAERATAGYFNTALVIDDTGREIGRYRKTHIPAYFPNAQPGGTGSYEKFYFTPGGALNVFNIAGTTIGVQICNDRLFPEASRVLALRGAEVLVMPICFSTYSDPVQRAAIWEVPLRARAYENGAFVLASNRVGVEGPRHHLGRSMIVDPTGTILREAGTDAQELLVAEIDLDDVAAARKRFPWWRDRRPELYDALAHVG